MPDDVIQKFGVARSKSVVVVEKLQIRPPRQRECDQLIVELKSFQQLQLSTEVPINSWQLAILSQRFSQMSRIKQWLIVMIANGKNAKFSEDFQSSRQPSNS